MASHAAVVVGAEVAVGVVVVSPPKPVRVVAQDVRVVAAVRRHAVAASGGAKGLEHKAHRTQSTRKGSKARAGGGQRVSNQRHVHAHTQIWRLRAVTAVRVNPTRPSKRGHTYTKEVKTKLYHRIEPIHDNAEPGNPINLSIR